MKPFRRHRRDLALPLAAVAFALLLARCSSTQIAPTPTSALGTASPDEANGSLVVYRTGADAMVTATIRLDGIEAGRLPPNTFLRFDLPTGAYTIGARSSTNIAKRTVRIEPGKTLYIEQSFVIDFRATRRVKLEPRDRTRGSEVVRKLSPAPNRYDTDASTSL